MKVIDLLNKIANEGVIPKKIKYKNTFYIFNEEKDNYYVNKTCSINWDYVSLHCLNDEVEILEEEKKIPEKSNIDFNTKLPVSGCSENEAFMMTCISHLGKTMDSLIDYLKSKGE